MKLNLGKILKIVVTVAPIVLPLIPAVKAAVKEAKKTP